MMRTGGDADAPGLARFLLRCMPAADAPWLARFLLRTPPAADAPGLARFLLRSLPAVDAPWLARFLLRTPPAADAPGSARFLLRSLPAADAPWLARFLLRTPPAAVAPGLPGSCTAVSGLPPFLLLIYLLDFYMHTYLCCVAAGLGRTLFSLGAAVWAHLILFAIQCPAGGVPGPGAGPPLCSAPAPHPGALQVQAFSSSPWARPPLPVAAIVFVPLGTHLLVCLLAV